MTLILIATSFLASMIFTIILRRLDRPALKLAQMKRMADIQATQLNEATQNHLKNINDAALDFEMLFRQSRQMQTELKNDSGLIQEKIDNLKVDRETIENISEELGQITVNAEKVTQQIQHLDSGLSRLGFAQKEIVDIQEKISGLNGELNGHGIQAQMRLDEIITSLVKESDEKISAMIESANEAFKAINQDNNRITKKIEERHHITDQLSQKISTLNVAMEEKWSLESNRLEEKFVARERIYIERINTLESGLTGIRTAALESIQDEVARIRSDLDNFNLKTLSGRDEILNETRRMAEGINDQIGNFQEKYLDVENKLTKFADQQKRYIEDKIVKIDDDWNEREEKHTDHLKNKTTELEEQISEIRDIRIESLKKETEGFITTMQDLRKDEETRIAQTQIEIREMLDGSSRSIEKEIATRIYNMFENEDFNLESIRVQFSRLKDEINNEMERYKTTERTFFNKLEGENQKLQRFQEKLSIVQRADVLVQKLDETVEVLTERLKLATEENKNIDGYVRNFETLRFNRKEMESEIKLLENQRSRLTQIEANNQDMEKELDALNSRFSQISKQEEAARKLAERVAQIENHSNELKKFFIDIGDKKTFFEKAVRHIENSRQQAAKTGKHAEELLQKIERAELRQEEIGLAIQSMESRSSSLQNMDDAIQKVEARFEQMDGLLIDLENKQKQINVMARKTEEMKKNSEAVKIELESVMGEADEKMDRLSAFFHTIEGFVDGQMELIEGMEETDAEVLTVKKHHRGKHQPLSPGLSDLKRSGILSLYLNHKWEAELIAERMKIEPAVVRAVIAGHTK